MTSGPESRSWQEEMAEALRCDSQVDLVGVGNDMRGDDALGIEIASRLRSKLKGPKTNLKVHPPTRMPERLLSSLAASSARVVIFDAVEASLPAGSIVCSRLGDTKYGYFATHNVPLKLIPGVDARLGDFYVLGVQPKALEVGEGLSAAVEAAVQRIVEIITSAGAPPG